MTSALRRPPLPVVLVAGALLGSGGATAPRRPAAPPAADTSVTTQYDVAGVKVIHRHAPASEVVAVRLFLLGGTRQLAAATQGIEALLLTAAEGASQRRLAALGARTFVDPAADWTAVGFVSLPRDFAAAWRLFADWLSPVPPPDTAIDRARKVLVSAAERRYSHPDLRVQEVARAAAFPDHPYALDPSGTTETLAALTAADVARYRTEQFVRSRLLLVIVGAVPRAAVESLVSATLGRLPAGAYVWTPPPTAPRVRTRWRVEHRVLPTSYILGYFMGPEPTHEDYFAFQVATYILSGQLNRVIRDESSLSYAVSAPFFDRAIPAGGVYASTANPLAVYQLMRREVSDLKGVVIHPFVLRHFLNQLTVGRLAEQMTTAGQAEALGRAALYFGDFRMADGAWEKLRRVGPTAVRFAAEKYMRDFRLAYLGDTALMLGRW